jgi:hypothetical protein
VRQARDQGQDNGAGDREDSGNWEAPSFLKRPMPAAAAEGEPQNAPPERTGRGRRPRAETPSGDLPQGE